MKPLQGSPYIYIQD